jgi:hypothetical protein
MLQAINRRHVKSQAAWFCAGQVQGSQSVRKNARRAQKEVVRRTMKGQMEGRAKGCGALRRMGKKQKCQ